MQQLVLYYNDTVFSDYKIFFALRLDQKLTVC